MLYNMSMFLIIVLGVLCFLMGLAIGLTLGVSMWADYMENIDDNE